MAAAKKAASAAKSTAAEEPETAETAETEQAPATRNDVAHHSVPMSKAYGQATKAEHRRSGYILPDSFYEPDPPELAEHKLPGNQHRETND